MNSIELVILFVLIGIVLISSYNALLQVDGMVAIARLSGLLGFMLLCITLMIGPLAVLHLWFRPALIVRRAFGISSFTFMFSHFILTFFLYFNINVSILLTDLALLLGTLALALMLLLALISNSWCMKSIPFWKNLQRLAYVAFALSFVHFLLKANGLFLDFNSIAFANLSEFAMVALGLLTVLLQFWAFLVIRGRKTAVIAEA